MMDDCRNSCRDCKNKFLQLIASVICGILCAVNLIFFLTVSVLIILMVVSLLIGLLYQSILPLSILSAFGTVSLAGIGFPWLAALIGAIIDYSTWPISYVKLRGSLRELFGLRETLFEGETSENLRRLIYYFVPLVIWLLCFSVGISNSENENTGTIMFIVLSVLLIACNAFFDFIKLRRHGVDQSALLFMLFGTKRGAFAMTALVFSFLSLISVASSNFEENIKGGAGAVAVAFILIVLYFIFHLCVFMFTRTQTVRTDGAGEEKKENDGEKKEQSEDEEMKEKKNDDDESAKKDEAEKKDDNNINEKKDDHDDEGPTKEEWVARSTSTYVVAAIEIASLILSAACIWAQFGGLESLGPWMLLTFIVFTYATLIYEDTRIDINDMKLSSEEEDDSYQVDLNEEMVLSGENSIFTPSPSSAKHEPKNGDDDAASGTSSPPTRLVAVESLQKQASQNTNASGVFVDNVTEASKAIKAKRKKMTVGQRTLVRRIAYIICVLACLIIFVASLIDTSGDTRPLVCPGKYPTNRTAVSDKFTACSINFEKNFTIGDFTALALGTYMDDATYRTALDMYFPNDDVSVIGGSNFTKEVDENDDDSLSFIATRYITTRFSNKNITIIGVRGSATSLDWLYDVIIGSDVELLRIASSILPIYFSDDLRATLVDVISALKIGVMGYEAPVVREVRRIEKLYPGQSIYLNGHSLGGGTGNIAGGVTDTRTVTFSPIGTALQRKRFGFSVEASNRVITSIVPEGDIVPKIDIQLGSINRIVQAEPCNAGNALCHSLSLTAKTLLLNCGDDLGRFSNGKDEEIPAGCRAN